MLGRFDRADRDSRGDEGQSEHEWVGTGEPEGGIGSGKQRKAKAEDPNHPVAIAQMAGRQAGERRRQVVGDVQGDRDLGGAIGPVTRPEQLTRAQDEQGRGYVLGLEQRDPDEQSPERSPIGR